MEIAAFSLIEAVARERGLTPRKFVAQLFAVDQNCHQLYDTRNARTEKHWKKQG